MRTFLRTAILRIVLAAILMLPQLSHAQITFGGGSGGPGGGGGGGCCSCPATVAQVSSMEWIGNGESSTVNRLINHMTSELTAQRIWMISIFWEDNLLPALMLMSEQLTVVAMKQVEIIGTFLDAKHQMETQLVLQKIRAQAHKDYHPSIGICEFGSSVKSLAASDRKAEFNTYLMGQRSQDRNLGNAFTAASTGQDADKESRLDQFKKSYCDTADNNDGLGYLCSGGSAPAARRNKDIDFVRTIAYPQTLDVDFTDEDPGLTNDEEDVMALSANLFANDVFERPVPTSLKQDSANDITAMQEHYMNARSLIAKRSVAENSYNALMAMKSKGAPGSKDYLKGILKELGISQTDKWLGENPSYYAQMEVLGKKIYQDPDFYTNLYDKPANVDRKGVALQAIGLMQKFDLFKSYLRQEASLSVLLELAVMDLQQEVENDINRARAEGESAGN